VPDATPGRRCRPATDPALGLVVGERFAAVAALAALAHPALHARAALLALDPAVVLATFQLPALLPASIVLLARRNGIEHGGELGRNVFPGREEVVPGAPLGAGERSLHRDRSEGGQLAGEARALTTQPIEYRHVQIADGSGLDAGQRPAALLAELSRWGSPCPAEWAAIHSAPR